ILPQSHVIMIALRCRILGAWQMREATMPVDSQLLSGGTGGHRRARTEGSTGFAGGRLRAAEKELFALRGAGGRWPKGVSGNPAGRPWGSRNRATLMAE